MLLLNKIKLEELESFTQSFISYRRLLTKTQFDLLAAIALENGVSKPFSGEFITKYKLKSPSTIKSALDALSDKEMIVNYDNEWHVYDVFLMRWLEYS